jgi:3-hydroxyisobutyrate dehydrogenase
MGARMAARLLAADHEVTVWNRSLAKTELLGRAGAKIAGSPKAAAADAEMVIAMVRDDEASRAIWLDPRNGALAAMRRDTLAIESSTLSVSWVRELAQSAHSRGIGFLDAPVAGSRPQAEAGQLIYFVGGSAGHLERAEPILSVMGSSIHHAGPVGSGAAVKLAVNALFGIQVASVAELIGMARANGIDITRLTEIIGATPVCSPAAKAAIVSMLGGNFAPMFPVELVEKDLGYAKQAATSSGTTLPVSEAARSVMAAAIAQGYGNEHLTGVIRLYA